MALTPTVELGLGGALAGVAATHTTKRAICNMRRFDYRHPINGWTPYLWWTGGPEGTSWLWRDDQYGYLILNGNPTTGGAGSLPGGGCTLTLDGVDDYAEAFVGIAPGTDAMSLEWVGTLNAVPSAGQEPLIVGTSGFGLTYASDGRVYGWYNGAAVVDYLIGTGTRRHIVLTRSGTSPDVITLYVDGFGVDGAGPARASLGLASLYAGKHWSSAHYLSATYEFLGLYGVALTSGQVAANTAALSWTDVTADTRGTVPLTIERGIRDDRPSSRVASTGFCRFALNNLASNSGGVTGYYSPGHASCRAGFTKGIPARVKVGADVLFAGRVRTIAPAPGKESGVYTSVTVFDYMDTAATFLMDRPTLTPIMESVRGDQVFRAITAAIPTQPYGIVAAQGSDTYTLALDNTKDESLVVLQEYVRLANSELGYIYQRRTGELVYESRTTRRANQDTPRLTLDDTMHGLDVAEQASTALNRVQLTVHPRVIDAAATTVLWALVNSLQLEAGESKTLIGPYRVSSSPGITTRVGGLSMVTPVSTTDYTMNDASDGSGTDRTASLGVVANFGANGVQFIVTNNHTARAYVTKLQARGKGVYDFRTIVLRAQDEGAIAADGVNALTLDMPYQEQPGTAQALADDLLAAYGDLSGTRAKSVSMLLGDTGLPADLHLYDISDRIALAETITGASGEYYINGVRLECQSGRLPVLKWWLAPARFPVAMTAVAYNASNFTAAGGGSITVDSGDQVTYAYAVVDKMMDLIVWLQGIDVTGTVSSVSVAIPGGYVANRTAGLFAYLDDAGTSRDANCRVAAGGTVVTVSRADGSNLTATSSDNTTIRINARFEVQ